MEGIAGIILLRSGFHRFLTDVTAAYLAGESILIYGIYQIVNGSLISVGYRIAYSILIQGINMIIPAVNMGKMEDHY